MAHDLELSVAAHYAQVAADLTEKGCDGWDTVFDLVCQLMKHERAGRLFSSGRLSFEDLSGFLPKGVSPRCVRFVCIMFQNGRASLLPTVSEQYKKIMDVKRGVCRLDIYLAASQTMTKKLQDEIKKATEPLHGGKIVELSFLEDPKILGGFIAVSGYRKIDASLAGKLEQIKKRLRRTS
ncbi:MAG: FoF1 ATP synthase subunit delta [Pseudomonadota bacterium]|nr:FoF1 ATP synthase subunit delta [Pseudomonadota bacterium]MEC8461186.1 FoF1 ATP synthase subunit delta [Pseudomonadota bacterium]